MVSKITFTATVLLYYYNEFTNYIIFSLSPVAAVVDNEVDQCTVTINESIAVITLTKKLPVHWNNLDTNSVTKLLIPSSDCGKL